MGGIGVRKQIRIFAEEKLGLCGALLGGPYCSGIEAEDHAVVTDDPGRTVCLGSHRHGNGFFASCRGLACIRKAEIFADSGSERIPVAGILQDLFEGYNTAGSGVKSNPLESRCGTA